MFYAEWCEYCKDFLPTWYKLSNIYANKGVKFGLVEWYFFFINYFDLLVMKINKSVTVF